MKKLLFVFVFLMLMSTAAFAEEATLPTFDVTLNGQKIESSNREYPLLVYNDITYFPMTYFDCRFLGLTTDWDNDTCFSLMRAKTREIERLYDVRWR